MLFTLWLLVRAALIVGAGVLAGSWLEGEARSGLDRGRLDPAVREALVRMVRPGVVLLAVLVAFASVGLDATGIVAVVAAVVLALGLSWREALANGAAGALLLTWRPYRGGDRVKVAGTKGVVTDVTLFATTLKTAPGVHVTVPNRLVLAEAVENHSRNGILRIEVALRVVPGADVDKLAGAVTAALADDARFAKEPAPTVHAEALHAEGLDVRVSAWASSDDPDAARSALVLVARDAARKAKIDLAPGAR